VNAVKTNTNLSTLWFLILLFTALGCTRHRIADEYARELTAFDIRGGAGLPYFVGRDLRPVWNLDSQTPAPRRLLDFSLTDQKLKKLDAAELNGKISVVSFFYSECGGLCPLAMKNLQRLENKIKNDSRFILLSISVDPEHDTPQKLRQYAEKLHIDEKRWKLLTGKRDEIYTLARESFSADTYSAKENSIKKLTSDDFLHSENIYLLDTQRNLRGIYQSQQLSSLDDLAHDMETLAK
jgi:protein SCO1/2